MRTEGNLEKSGSTHLSRPLHRHFPDLGPSEMRGRGCQAPRSEPQSRVGGPSHRGFPALQFASQGLFYEATQRGVRLGSTPARPKGKVVGKFDGRLHSGKLALDPYLRVKPGTTPVDGCVCPGRHNRGGHNRLCIPIAYI